MDIEKIATSAFTNLISKTDRLQSFVSEGDREPHWDGSVHVYSGIDKKETQSIGRVPTQVKGVSANRFHPKKPRISVRVSDLRQYLEEGGALYVVGAVSKTGDCKLYFCPLQPFDIKKIFETLKDRQASKEIALFPLPDDLAILENIFFTFLKDRKLQRKIIDEPSLPDFSQYLMDQTVQLSLSYADITGQHTPEPGFSIQFPCYLYASVDGEKKFPVARVDNAVLEKECRHIEEPIVCGKTTFFDSYDVTRTKGSNEVSFGNKFVYRDVFEDNSLEFRIEAGGTISERLQTVRFSISMIEHGGFYLGSYFIDIGEQFKEQFDSLSEALRELEILQAGLRAVGCKKDLDLDSFCTEDLKKIHYFAWHIVNDKPVTLNFCNELQPDHFRLTILRCGPLMLALACTQDDNGKFRCKNLFNSSAAFRIHGTEIKMSPYLALVDPEELFSVDNIDYQQLVDSFDDMVYCEEIADKVRPHLLALLLKYDKEQKPEQLQAAIKISSWLVEGGSVNKDTPTIDLLNFYQTILRQRPLDDSEIETLLTVVENPNTAEDQKVGAYLLLGNIQAANIHMKRLSEEEQKQFLDYPIYRFAKPVNPQ